MSGHSAPTAEHPNPWADLGWLAEDLFGPGPFALALVDNTLHYVRVSHAFAEILGHEAEHFVGKHAFRNGFSAKHKAVMQQALATGRTRVLKNWTTALTRQKTEPLGYWQWTVMPLPFHQAEGQGLLLWGRDVTERRVLESEVIEAATRERQEVGRQIHDNIGQLLAAVNMKVKLLECKLEDQHLDGCNETQELRDLVRSVISIQRRVARRLYPLDVASGGFLAALEHLVDDTALQYGVSCQATAPDQGPDLEDIQATHILAVIRGVIEHAVNQAGAQNLTVDFTIGPESYIARVVHDGKAFNRLGMIKGHRLMTYHAHAIGGTLNMEKNDNERMTFTGRFPTMIGDHR